jgi:hypothetical protein
MQRITSADHRKLSVFVRELYCLSSVGLILNHVARGLCTLIASDSVFVPMAGPERRTITLLADNIGPELHKMWPILVALRHDNPAISHHMSHPEGPAFMIGDLCPMSEWTRTKVFNEFYSNLEMMERLSLSLSFSRPDIVGIVAHRSRCCFTERDRSVLNLLRFHVSQACVTAKARVTTPSGSMIEALESLVGGSIVEVDSGGKVRFSSDLAQQDFESFFSREKPFYNGLPVTVKRWACRRCQISTPADYPFVRRNLWSCEPAIGRFVSEWQVKGRNGTTSFCCVWRIPSGNWRG